MITITFICSLPGWAWCWTFAGLEDFSIAITAGGRPLLAACWAGTWGGGMELEPWPSLCCMVKLARWMHELSVSLATAADKLVKTKSRVNSLNKTAGSPLHGLEGLSLHFHLEKQQHRFIKYTYYTNPHMSHISRMRIFFIQMGVTAASNKQRPGGNVSKCCLAYTVYGP